MSYYEKKITTIVGLFTKSKAPTKICLILGAVAAMAFTQRGCLYRFMGRDKEAAEDLEKASDLGSQFARHVLVEMNPYAALCNNMLSSVMQKCREGKQPFC